MGKKLSEATVTKYATQLLGLYVELYEEKYQKVPTMNRFKQKWGFKDMIEDLGKDHAEAVIRYYFRTSRVGHPIEYLLYNYEKLNGIRLDIAKDAIDRERLRKETAERVKEWDARGNN